MRKFKNTHTAPLDGVAPGGTLELDENSAAAKVWLEAGYIKPEGSSLLDAGASVSVFASASAPAAPGHTLGGETTGNTPTAPPAADPAAPVAPVVAPFVDSTPRSKK